MLRFKARPRKDPTESPFLTPSQRRIIAGLGTAMGKVRDAAIRNEGQILDAILHGPPSRLIDLVPETPWYEAQEEMQTELTAELLAAGQRYGAMIPPVQKAAVNFRFDESRPEAAGWAAKEAGNMIVEVVEEQRAVVRDLAARASMGEFTPREAARGIRDVIGLTSQQSGWVSNYRARQVAELRAQGLSPAQVAARADRLTDRYHARIHRYRSENIARTEILRASHEGRQQAWQQGLDQGYISPNSSKQWSANQDGRVCDECSFLDGLVVPLAGTFPGGEPPLHPSCRCDVLLVPLQPTGIDELQALTDAELDAQINDLLTGGSSALVAAAPDWQPAFNPTFATGARFFNDNVSGPQWGNAKYAKWQEKWADTPNGAAVYDYSTEFSPSGYRNVNRRLRVEGYDPDFPDGVNTSIRQLGDALDDAVVPEDVIGIRGLTVDQLPDELQALFNDVQPGALIHDPGFMSISLADKPALGTDIYLRVRVPAGSRGAYLGRLSKYNDQEQELLLQSGSTLRVVSSTQQGGRLYVDAEVVAQNLGARTPPAELMKQRLSYLRFMAEQDAVQKRADAPLEPEFDENGVMNRMGQKLHSPITGIVIVPPPSR